jgi:hypothetical protein
MTVCGQKYLNLDPATIQKYSEAIINNCQYMMLFQLNSGNVNNLSHLLTGSATLTKEEEKLLTILETGNCLFQISQIQRLKLSILASEEEFELFKT